MTPEDIAVICHEANRAYCRALGDDSQAPWGEAPSWQRASAIKGVAYHRTILLEGRQPLASASHEAWLKEKQETGWTYGLVKDEAAKTHPCCVPYNELPKEQQMKDYLFGAVVAAFYDAGLLK